MKARPASRSAAMSAATRGCKLLSDWPTHRQKEFVRCELQFVLRFAGCIIKEYAHAGHQGGKVVRAVSELALDGF